MLQQNLKFCLDDEEKYHGEYYVLLLVLLQVICYCRMGQWFTVG